MKINKKEIHTLDTKDDSPMFCPYCAKHHFSIMLVERSDYTGHDKDLWRICPNCKRIIPIYEIKREGKLEPTFETSDNPFDSAGKIAGLGNKRKKRLGKQSDIEALDDDIKRELKAGNTVEVF